LARLRAFEIEGQERNEKLKDSDQLFSQQTQDLKDSEKKQCQLNLARSNLIHDNAKRKDLIEQIRANGVKINE
jgi:hypothetical protein